MQRWLELERVPALFVMGPTGTGKSTAILECIAEQNCTQQYNPFKSQENRTNNCQCFNCQRIHQFKTPDVLYLKGQEPVKELREAVADFYHHPAKELKWRYLVMRQAGMHTKDAMDSILKLLEQPPDYLRFFITANGPSVPGAILSRCHVIKHPYLTPTQLKQVVDLAPSLAAAKGSLDKYPFKTTRQLLLYSKFDLDTIFRKLFVEPSSPEALAELAKKTLSSLETETEFPLPEARAFLFRFLFDRLMWYIDVNSDVQAKLAQFHILWHHLIQGTRETLLANLDNPRAGQFLNMENQFTGILRASTIAKELANA